MRKNRIGGDFESDPDWFPEVRRVYEAPTLADRFAVLSDIWFKRYNPFYFFSALCIFSGVFLLSQGLDEIGWRGGEFVLFGIVQAYEILLIAGAWLLFRVARMKRPAVILGLMEVVFLFDLTLRTESLAAVGGAGIVFSAAWVVLAALKIAALLDVFRLRIRPALLLPPVAAIAAVAFTPHLLSAFVFEQGEIHLLATGFFTLLAGAISLLRPRLESTVKLTPWERTVLHRTGRAVWAIWGGFYLVHLASWMVQFDLDPVLPLLGVLMPVPLFFAGWKHEGWAWAAGVAGMALMLVDPWTVAPACILYGLILAAWAWRRKQERLFAASLACFYGAAWTCGWKAGPPPEPELICTIVASGLLMIFAFWRRRLSAGFLAAALWIPFAGFLVPESKAELGILLLASGFIALVVGVSLNWNKRLLDEAPAPKGRA
jgi:hypothetical protein